MKSRILITIGDINGIGPEIILKTLNRKDIREKYDVTIISPIPVLEFYYRLFNLKPPKKMLKIISVGSKKPKITPGKITEESGYISGLAIQTAVELLHKYEFDALVTAPISKKAFNLGGFQYSGHTEMITHLCKVHDSVMVMLHPKLKIGFASTHPPIKDVAGILGTEMLSRKLEICFKALKNDFALRNPSIGVLALNPHAGENGQIGDEEIKIIKPAIEKIASKFPQLKIAGPYSPDAYFANKNYTNFDLTFAMYHDQGLIPFKMLSGMRGVNYTAGLEIIRTSPDHGTAYDIAGKNIADESSFVEAIKYADKIFKTRSRLNRK